MLEILGVPFAAPLAVLAGPARPDPARRRDGRRRSSIGSVTLFNDFPTDTIIWAIWAIVYQQVENNVIQPQIQRRTVQRRSRSIVLVSVLFGATLLGRARRARGDPGRGVDPDHGARVVAWRQEAAAAIRRRAPAPAARRRARRG